MPVAVSRRQSTRHAQQVQIVFPVKDAAPTLMHDCTLGAGIRARVNAANPGQWHAIWVDALNDDTRPLLAALIGPAAVQQLDSQPGPSDGPGTMLEWFDFDWADGPLERSREPWLRVAAVDVLDRCLQLPLNQALIDAERGVARLHAASTLERGQARNDVLADALGLARAASWALVDYLRRLARNPHPVPESLRKVLADLVDGYHALADELSEPDEQLRSVVKAGRDVLDRLHAGVGKGRSRTLRAARLAPVAALVPPCAADVISLIDPRQIPARVLRLSMKPAAGEVHMRAARVNGGDAVVIEVPAYEPGGGDLRGGNSSEQLLVRLIDTETGADVDGAVLTLERGVRQLAPIFRAVVPMPAVGPYRLRADIYDGTSDEPPVPCDTHPDLLSSRRTAAMLASWRRLVAAVRLDELQVDINAKLRALIEDPNATADELTEGSELAQSVDESARRAMIAGPGDLLVAELDAASGLIAS